MVHQSCTKFIQVRRCSSKFNLILSFSLVNHSGHERKIVLHGYSFKMVSKDALIYIGRQSYTMRTKFITVIIIDVLKQNSNYFNVNSAFYTNVY